MRAIWKGSISFGLVNIPVGLYSATKAANEVKFRLLRDKDLSPVKYKRVAESDGSEVPWEHIVKGYEHEKNNFIVMTEKDFEAVNIKSNQTVDIKEFVELSDIDPMFFDQPYFLAPEKGGDKAYSLLRDSLKASGKVGIAKVVIKTREHLAAVKPMGKALVLELMHFSDELADPTTLPLPDVEVGKKEMSMAGTLIESMTDKWDPSKYADDYREGLMKVIEEKIAAGGKQMPTAQSKAAKPTNVVDLMAVLQQSLAQAQKPKAAKGHSVKHLKKHKKAA